ncbi:MAG: ADP-forming succinate--CoA ligase subunit beta [Candidatus Eisenbacteria bacterium]|nr:ADP-forming succinate--CoA ligase subunit beta [Candidatus Eisenbacteria bacterium]
MKIHEYQAKEILSRYEVPMPPFEVVDSPSQARAFAERTGAPIIVKAQVHVGGRGKAGGVKFAADPDEAERSAADILGMDIKGLTVGKVIVYEAVDIADEIYIGVVIDRASKRPVFMVSSAGGVDIEEVASATPEKIHRHPVDPQDGLSREEAAALGGAVDPRPDVARRIGDVIFKLWTAFNESDASLAEINPLVVTPDGDVSAVDAKMLIDDNALFRHEDIAAMRDPSLETDETRRAREAGLSYVKLDGTVGCLVNGAGLAMTTMDVIKHFGGEPANFLDIGGSSTPEKVVTALDIISSDPGVKAILINIFGGITRCDDVARGLIEAFERRPLDLGVVVRLTGTNEEEARELLSEHDLVTAATMDDAVQKVVEMAGRAA